MIRLTLIRSGLKSNSKATRFETYKELRAYSDNTTLKEHDASANEDLLYCVENGKMYRVYKENRAGIKSQFDFSAFIDDYQTTRIAFNKKKYTAKEALEQGRLELQAEETQELVITENYVFHGFGVMNGEVINGWWLELDYPLIYTKKGRIPVWVVAIKEKE